MRFPHCCKAGRRWVHQVRFVDLRDSWTILVGYAASVSDFIE